MCRWIRSFWLRKARELCRGTFRRYRANDYFAILDIPSEARNLLFRLVPSMIFPRRRFLGASLVGLGGTLADALATPLWRWRTGTILQAVTLPEATQGRSAASAAAKSPVQFVDVAREAGITARNVWGAVDHKNYIIEAKGAGLAFFDYDNDGWLDVYLTNGTRLGTQWPAGQAPTSHLYKNNRDGTFTDVTEKSGLARTGWQTGVCIGDYDNDGWD